MLGFLRRKIFPVKRVVLSPYVTVGRHTYGVRPGMFFHPTAQSPVTIGSFCSLAPGVRFMCHAGHPTNLPSTYPIRTLITRRNTPPPPNRLNHDAVTKGPITVGHDVWIGENAVILSGLTIGTGAVIGTGAIVTKNVEPYAIVVGSPARVVKKRHEQYIPALLASRWWELTDDEIASLDDVFYSQDISRFLQRVREAFEARGRA